MAHVVHLSSVHRAVDTRILHRECRSLAAAGHDVTLIARHPQPEVVGGVRIDPLPVPPHRLHRVTRTVGEVARRAVSARADLYHLHDPELVPTGLMLRALGHRVVYDVHEDPAAQVLSKPWIPTPLRPAARHTLRAAEGGARLGMSGVVVAEPEHLRRFPGPRTALVQNFPFRAEFDHVARPPWDSRPHRITYVGSMSRARGMVELVAAVGRLGPELGVRLALAGSLPDPLRAECATDLGWARTDALGFCDRAKVASLLAGTRVGLCVLHPEPNYVNAWPTKLFEYMAAEIPVIASDFPLWRRIVEEAGCGLLVDPQDVDGIAAAIDTLLRQPERAAEMGRRGREAFLDRFCFEHEASRLLRFYEALLA